MGYYTRNPGWHFILHRFGCIIVFGIWMSDGNQLPPAGETACPTYFAKRLINKVGQAVSPAVPMATTNGRHLYRQTNSRNRLSTPLASGRGFRFRDNDLYAQKSCRVL